MPPKTGTGSSLYKKLQAKKDAEARAFSASTKAANKDAERGPPFSEEGKAMDVDCDGKVVNIKEQEEEVATAGPTRSLADIQGALRALEGRQRADNARNGTSKPAAVHSPCSGVAAAGDTAVAEGVAVESSSPPSSLPPLVARGAISSMTAADPHLTLRCDSVALSNHIMVPLEAALQWRSWGEGSIAPTAHSQSFNATPMFKTQMEHLMSLSVGDEFKLAPSSPEDKEAVAGKASPSLGVWGLSMFGRALLRTLRLTSSAPAPSHGTDNACDSIIFGGSISDPLGGGTPIRVAIVPTQLLFTHRLVVNESAAPLLNGLAVPPDTVATILTLDETSPAVRPVRSFLDELRLRMVLIASQGPVANSSVTFEVDLTRLGNTSGMTAADGGGRYPSLRGLRAHSSLCPSSPSGAMPSIQLQNGHLVDPLFSTPTGTSTSTKGRDQLMASTWGSMPLDPKRLVLVEQLLPQTRSSASLMVSCPLTSTHPALIKERFRSTLQRRLASVAATLHGHPQGVGGGSSNGALPIPTLPNTPAVSMAGAAPCSGLESAKRQSGFLKDLVRSCVPADVAGAHPRQIVCEVATKLLLCTLQRDTFAAYGIDIPKGVLLFDQNPGRHDAAQSARQHPATTANRAQAVGKTFLLGAIARSIADVNAKLSRRQYNGQAPPTGSTSPFVAFPGDLCSGVTLCISVDAHSLVTKEVGGTEKNIANMMKLARRGEVPHFATEIKAPTVSSIDSTSPPPVVVATVLFIDNLETIAPPRKGEGGGGASGDRALSTLLTELDGIQSTAPPPPPPPSCTTSNTTPNRGERVAVFVPVVVVASSSGLRSLDPAVYRPGRLDLHIPLAAAAPATSWKVLLSALGPLYQSVWQVAADSGASDVPVDGDAEDGFSAFELRMLERLVPVLGVKGDGESATMFGRPVVVPELTVTDAKLIARQATYRFVASVTAIANSASSRVTASILPREGASSRHAAGEANGVDRWLFDDDGVASRIGLGPCQLELTRQVQAAVRLISPLTLFKYANEAQCQ